MEKINLTESEFKNLIQITVKRVLSEQKKLNEEFRKPLYDNNDIEEILKNYLNNALSLVGYDPETEDDWDSKYNINDFDEETILQARKDIKWFVFKADKYLKQILKKFGSKLENSEVAWGLVCSRNLGDYSFWNVYAQYGGAESEAQDDIVAKGLNNIAIQLGYIKIIKTEQGKLKIVKREN